ncbi:hypothetical protein EMPS_04929 [Entomortierella parvispora]|uniref:Uncharacterized protein n=1 Tax=Entomortierella parvispora TaxID=205924 RepID=A0A9P3H9I2_9FUNG|nr:hypothetical protein EMPS_04929 [Entomortierella parvispora]
MTFTLKTVLNTSVPNVLELIEYFTPVMHKVSGTLLMHVQKPMRLEQLSVSFVCQVEGTEIYRSDFHAIAYARIFVKGNYRFPFVLDIPSDLSAACCARLRSQQLTWGYKLITCGIPDGLEEYEAEGLGPASGMEIAAVAPSTQSMLPSFKRSPKIKKLTIQLGRRSKPKKNIYEQRLKLQKVWTCSIPTGILRFGACRGEDQFACSIYMPRIVHPDQRRLSIAITLKSFYPQFKVREIHVVAIQQEKIVFVPEKLLATIEGLRAGVNNFAHVDLEDETPLVSSLHNKPISPTIVLRIPSQDIVREHPTPALASDPLLEFEMDLFDDQVLPAETTSWLEISHTLKVTITFSDVHIKPMIIHAPLSVGLVLEGRQLLTQHEVLAAAAAFLAVGQASLCSPPLDPKHDHGSTFSSSTPIIDPPSVSRVSPIQLSPRSSSMQETLGKIYPLSPDPSLSNRSDSCLSSAVSTLPSPPSSPFLPPTLRPNLSWAMINFLKTNGLDESFLFQAPPPPKCMHGPVLDNIQEEDLARTRPELEQDSNGDEEDEEEDEDPFGHFLEGYDCEEEGVSTEDYEQGNESDGEVLPMMDKRASHVRRKRGSRSERARDACN